MKKVSILGATGSVGLNALKILASYKSEYNVIALTSARMTLPNQKLHPSPQVKFPIMVAFSATKESFPISGVYPRTERTIDIGSCFCS